MDLRVQGAESTARFDGSIEALKEAVDELREVVQDLRDTMNRGRGAIWLVLTGSASIGAVFAFIAKFFFPGKAP